MTIDLPLNKIAKEALAAFPPLDTELGEDRDAARNYAQRLLTKHISELRKSEQTVSDEDAQEQRQRLDSCINALGVTAIPDSPHQHENGVIETRAPDAPLHMAQITARISACFHTTTDGSPKHLAVLRRRAASELNQYLSEADIGWSEKRRFKSKGKRLIDMHMKDISQGSGATENGDTL